MILGLLHTNVPCNARGAHIRGNEIKFDSDTQDEYEDDAISLDDLSESYYTVTFADGDAEVLLLVVDINDTASVLKRMGGFI